MYAQFKPCTLLESTALLRFRLLDSVPDLAV